MKKVLTTITIAVIISIASTYYTISKYDRNKEIKEKEKIELLALSEEIEEIFDPNSYHYSLYTPLEIDKFKILNISIEPFNAENFMGIPKVTHIAVVTCLLRYNIEQILEEIPKRNIIVFLNEDINGFYVIHSIKL